MAVLRARADFLSAGAFSENHGLHVASGVIFDSLAATKKNQLATARRDCSVYFPRLRDGHGFDVVGAIPYRHARSALRAQPARSDPHRQPRCLVLPQQIVLAVQSDVHLSEMENSR